MASSTTALSLLIGAGIAASAITTGYAQEKDMRVLGWYGNQPQSTEIARPFWEKVDEEEEGGLAVQFRSMDEIGLKGFEALRTLQSGAFDVVSFQISFVGGEAPVLMGADLPGLAFNFDELENIVDAYRPVLEEQLSTQFNGHLLAVWPFPFQILYCKGDVKSMADLAGRKVRVSGVLTAELVQQMGGAAVTLAGPEVYQALMQGVVDCAITGSQYGNSNDWFEVTDSQIDIPIGGAGLVLTVARNDFWNSLSPDQQAYLDEKMKGFEASLWQMAREGHQEGIRCNTGQTPCDAKVGGMALVEPAPADIELIKKTLKEDVIPIWLSDCEKSSSTCRDDWNRTIGTAVGLQM